VTRTSKPSILLCAALAVLVSLGQAGTVFAGTNTWTTNGPAEAVNVVVVDPLTPSTLYAGTEFGGVQKSTDSGGSWNPVNTGLPYTMAQVYALAIDPATPTTLYVGFDGNDQGIYKTTNGGGSWFAINTGLAELNIFSLAVDPSTPATVYAGTNGAGVFKSTDGGLTWAAANTGLTYLHVRALAINPATPATLYVGTAVGGVFKSTDGGGIWSAVNTGLTTMNVTELQVHPTDTDTVYAGTLGGGVFKSTNGGGGWSAVNTGLPYLIIYGMTVRPTTVYLGTQNGVYISRNGGDNWYLFNSGIPAFAHINSLAVDPVTPTIVHAGVATSDIEGGVYTIQSTAPGAFAKSSPADGSFTDSAPTLSWTASSGATYYVYCYDTSDDDLCAGTWTTTDETSADLSGLTDGTTYYWQVYAVNPATSKWADGGWWSFHYRTETFADVPDDYWAWSYVERLYAAGITGGCGSGPLIYCPASGATRGEMAVFLERGIQGASYTPPAPSGTVFTDVPVSHWAAAWIEQLAADGITGGCGGGNYCPAQAVTRAEVAILLLRSEHGSSYTPPAASGTVFTDVPISHWAAAWIEQLSTEGITGGCGGGNYCPNNPVTRAEMAVFLVRTFNLP
jgi:hypothetical protein